MSLPTAGQGAAADLFGGYSSLRSAGDNVPGAGLGLTWRSDRSLRLTAEVTSQFGQAAGDDLTSLALLAGPTFVPWRERRLRPFLHVKVGAGRVRRKVEVFGVAIGPDGVCDGGCPWQTGLVGEAGGGLDLRLTRQFSLRLPQADYRWSRSAGDTERGLRLSAGVVYKLTAVPRSRDR
jgi:hypothetical protein